MRNYNFMRPLMIIAVAFLANNLTKFVCGLIGVAEDTTSNVAMLVTIIAVILTFIRLQKQAKKR